MRLLGERKNLLGFSSLKVGFVSLSLSFRAGRAVCNFSDLIL